MHKQLQDQGFKPCDHTGRNGNYELWDDSDGKGPYIKEWKSDKRCPFPEKLYKPEDGPK